MVFDPNTARPVKQATSFNPDTAKPISQQDEVHTILGGIANIPLSAYNNIAMIPSALKVLYPPSKEAQTLGGLLTGNKELWSATKKAFLNRYGSIDKAMDSAYHDPIGVAVDIGSILSGVGGVMRGAGKLATLPKLAQAGATLTKTAESLSPLKLAEYPFRATGAITAPYASMVEKSTLESAERLGIPRKQLPASTISKSPAVQSLEALGARSLFGTSLSKKVEKLGQTIKTKSEDLVKQIGGEQDLYTTGTNVAKSLDDFRDEWFKTKDELYKTAGIIEASGQPVIVKPMQSLEYIKKIVKQKRDAQSVAGVSDIKYFSNLEKSLSRDIPGNQLYNTIKELRKKVTNYNDPVVTGNQGELKKLVTLLSEDLDNAISTQRPADLKFALGAANKYYKEGVTILDSELSKKIYKLVDTGKTEQIVKTITNTNVGKDQLVTILDTIKKTKQGGNVVNDVKTAFVNDLFESVTTPTSNVIKSNNLAQKIKNLERNGKLNILLNPEEIKTLKDISQLSYAHQVGQKIATGSQTAFLGRLGSEIGAFSMDKLLPFRLLGIDAITSAFVLSPLGQRWLTSGWQLPTKIANNINRINKLPLVTGASQVGFQTGRLNNNK